MITVMTPTGDRKLAFDLCRQWMQHQTVKPDQWIVVDDGVNPMKEGLLPSWAFYVRRKPSCADPKHTLTINMKCALHFIKGDKILIMEDDEYYGPGYIEEISRRLDYYDVVGVGCSKYYHVTSGSYQRHQNMKHASLAQTAFRSFLLPVFKECVEKGMEHRWLDDWFWEVVNNFAKDNRIRPHVFVDEPSIYAGIKGLPGRPGICLWHKAEQYENCDNASADVLKSWVPEHYNVYAHMRGGWHNE